MWVAVMGIALGLLSAYSTARWVAEPKKLGWLATAAAAAFFGGYWTGKALGAAKPKLFDRLYRAWVNWRFPIDPRVGRLF